MVLENLTLVPVCDAGAFSVRLRAVTLTTPFGFGIESKEQTFLVRVFAEGSEAVWKTFGIRLEPVAASLAPRRAVHDEDFDSRSGRHIHTLFHRFFVVIRAAINGKGLIF